MQKMPVLKCVPLCLLAGAVMAGGITAKSGGRSAVSIVASTNVSTRMIVQTTAPDGTGSVRIFENGREIGAADAAAEAPLVTWLGVTTEATSDALRAQLSLDPGAGLTVFAVVPDSPADAAGLKVHDILLRLNDQILMDPGQLSNLVRARKAGDAVKLTYLRRGQEHEAAAVLAERADNTRGALEVIDLGEFDLDLGQLMKRMPQFDTQFPGSVFNLSTGWSFGSGGAGIPGHVGVQVFGGASSDAGALPAAAEILKQLKIDDPEVRDLLDEAMKALEKNRAQGFDKTAEDKK
jgi:hypothetical protein